MGDRQDAISAGTYDALYQLVEQIHDDAPELTPSLKDFYVRRITDALGLTIEKPYANITEEELDAICTRVQELRIEIVQINETIGRMFEKGNITADMIVEALNEKVDPDDHEWLKVIFNSWQENPQSKYEVIPQFSLILKTIRSYQ